MAALDKDFNLPRKWSDIAYDAEGNPPSRSICIDAVPLGTTGAVIQTIFSSCGEIVTSTPAPFAEASSSRAFVTYRDIDSARQALFDIRRVDLFGPGKSAFLRFAHPHTSTSSILEVEDRLREARSTWFHPPQGSSSVSLTRTNDQRINDEQAEMVIKEPPTAPRALRDVQRGIVESSSMLNSTRKDVSPPPIRRKRETDTYRPAERTDVLNDSRYRPGRQIDRYVPTSHDRESTRGSPTYQHPARTESLQQPGSLSPMHHVRNSKIFAANSTTNSFAPHKLDAPMIGTSRNSADLPLAHEVELPADSELTTAAGNHPLHTTDMPSTPSTSTVATSKFSNTAVDSDRQATNSTGPMLTLGSASVQRLRAPADDSSSIASTSTKSSQRKRQCSHCKGGEGAILGVFTKCGSCSRRYHRSCGNPKPMDILNGDHFTCGPCLRKAGLRSDPRRGISPELGSTSGDVTRSMASASTNAGSLPDEISHPRVADLTRKGTIVVHEPQDDDYASVSMVLSDLTSPLKPSVARTVSFTVPDGADNRPLIAQPPEMEFEGERRFDIPLNPSNDRSQNLATKENGAGAFRVTGYSMPMQKIRVDAARMVLRYKTLTCSFAPRSAFKQSCQHGNSCMYAHHDTKRYLPPPRKRDLGWTCHYWHTNQSCSHRDVCLFAHRDTGFFMGPDGRPSTKHIVCKYWREGSCSKTKFDCLYAHVDTGVYYREPLEQTEHRLAKEFELVRAEYGTDTSFSPVSALRSSSRCDHRQDFTEQGMCRRNPAPPHPAINLDGSSSNQPQAQSAISLSLGSAIVNRLPQAMHPQPNHPQSSLITSVGNNSRSEGSSEVTHSYLINPTADPRLKRPMQLAKRSSENVVGNSSSNMTHCEGCGKAIKSSSISCLHCTSLDTMASLREEAEGQGTTISVSPRGGQGPTPTSLEETAATAFLDKVATSTLTVASKQQHGTLKRRNEDSLFIPRKRPRTDLLLSNPLTGTVATAKSQVRPRQEIAEIPVSLEELTRLAREEKRRSSISISNDGSGYDDAEDNVDEVAEDQHPTFSPFLGSEEGLNSARGLESQQNGKFDEFQDPPQPDDSNLMTEHSTKPARTCKACSKKHRKCLHDGENHLDPRKCRAHLRQYHPDLPKGYSKTELQSIRQAASQLGELDSGDSDAFEPRYGAREEDLAPEAESVVVYSIHSTSESEDEEAVNEDDGPARSSGSEEESETELRQSFEGSKLQEEAAVIAPPPHARGQTAIPTPAQTPSPFPPDEEGPHLQSSEVTEPQRNIRAQNATKLEAVIAKLKKRGVQFDSDSDSDGDDAMEDTLATTASSSRKQIGNRDPLELSVNRASRSESQLTLKQSSLDLFEVAPNLRPAVQQESKMPSQRSKLNKKDVWANLLKLQTSERRAQFDDPHKIVARTPLPSQKVTTTIAQEEAITEAQFRSFDPPSIEDKQVQKTWEEFLKMPQDPVIVRERVTMTKNRGKAKMGVQFELAFRDGKKMKERGINAAGKRMRDNGVNDRWIFTGRG